MKEKINLSFEVKDFDLLDTHSDHAIVRAKIVNVGRNNNDTSFSKQCIEEAIPTLYNIPLIGIYNDLESDFKSHAHTETERSQTYAVGTIPESCHAHFEEHNGMEYLVADIVVWKEYFPNFYEVMARNEESDSQTTISMEISLYDYEKMDGYFEVKQFAFNGICLLGENVRPGIPDAGLRVIRFEEGKLELDNESLYEKLIKATNEEYELLVKYSEKALSGDNEEINNINFEKGEVGNMSEENKVLEDTQVVETVETEEIPSVENFEEVKEEPTTESAEVAEAEATETAEGDATTEEVKEEAEEVEEPKVQETPAEAMEVVEEKPLTKSERKTFLANEKSYLEKIAYLKGELAAYKPYKAMYEEAEKEIKELLEYKEEAELIKLEQQKSDYFKTFGVTDFDEEDRDEIIMKINDYSFSYQEFKAFMADKVQKYGMKSRFQNITEVINMYAEKPTVTDKYAATVLSEEDKVLDKYTNI